MFGTSHANDDLDDSARTDGETIRPTCHTFIHNLMSLYGDQYLNQRPISEELERMERAYAITRLAGCVRCIDCIKVY